MALWTLPDDKATHDWRLPVPLDDVWERAHKIGDQKERRRGYRYDMTRSESVPAFACGLLGEYTIAKATGLPVDENRDDRRRDDFVFAGIGYDAKGQPYVGTGRLLGDPQKESWSSVLILVDICGKTRTGTVIGWATRTQFTRYPQIDLGHGPSLQFPREKMEVLLQNGLPPCLPSIDQTPEQAAELAKVQKRWGNECLLTSRPRILTPAPI